MAAKAAEYLEFKDIILVVCNKRRSYHNHSNGQGTLELIAFTTSPKNDRHPFRECRQKKRSPRRLIPDKKISVAKKKYLGTYRVPLNKKGLQSFDSNPLNLLVAGAGFEPATFGL
jgi:hypothetical protein